MFASCRQVHWAMHQLWLHEEELSSLLWFGKDIRPYLFCWAVFYCHLTQSNMSLMEKYWILMCFVLFELYICPFFSSIMLLWFSWYIMSLLMLYLSHSLKYLACKILGSESYIPINSPLVELLPLVLCFLETLIAAPLPLVIMALVCPLQSSCVA